MNSQSYGTSLITSILIIFYLAEQPTSHVPLGLLLKTGLLLIDTFYTFEQNIVLHISETDYTKLGRSEVPVNDTRGVLTGAAVVEVLTSVIEVAPVINSSSCHMYF